MFMEGCSSSIEKNEYNYMFSYLYVSSPVTTSMPIETSLGKTLNYNPILENLQNKQLTELLQKHDGEFS
jgi:hypothetical protein